MLQTLALGALAMLPLLAAATPDHGAATGQVDAADWQQANSPDRADAFADLALADEQSANPVTSLIDISLSVTEPSIAALFSTAVIWLLAINWRFRRERKRREQKRRTRGESPGKPLLPGA